MQGSVDIILLTYKPDKRVCQLIEMLEKQSRPINKIIIINTEEKYFHELFYGTNFIKNHQNIEVHHISKKEFDHGKTRNLGVRYSKSEVFVCMTQDAIPADEYLIERLTDALYQKRDIAAAYARQLPADDCREIEKFTRQFNYPDCPAVKSLADIDRLGIKTFFCSNVCAAYNREIFDSLGGFIRKTIFNEDMIYAGKAIKSGYRIAYAASAKVIHSHNYTCMQQLRRNFDLGVSQADHPEIFKDISSESEGMKLVKLTVKHLKSTGNARLIPYLFVSSGYKFIGYRLGTHYRLLPRFIIEKCTMNSRYWDL